ncbi:MAG: FYDLN acid domain-containing protein [Acidobacteriota bacterium]|nr:FYDLN acid domain-containing protein [Acidobacteriota bacterium]
MPDLGKKFECFNCRTKFYNLGKPEAICPKCGANQKDAKFDEPPAPAPRPPRRAILMEPVAEETANEFGDEPAPVEEPEEAADDDEMEEEAEIIDSPTAVREEEEY